MLLERCIFSAGPSLSKGMPRRCRLTVPFRRSHKRDEFRGPRHRPWPDALVAAPYTTARARKMQVLALNSVGVSQGIAMSKATRRFVGGELEKIAKSDPHKSAEEDFCKRPPSQPHTLH